MSVGGISRWKGHQTEWVTVPDFFSGYTTQVYIFTERMMADTFGIKSSNTCMENHKLLMAWIVKAYDGHGGQFASKPTLRELALYGLSPKPALAEVL